jgi:hypothetical protein
MPKAKDTKKPRAKPPRESGDPVVDKVFELADRVGKRAKTDPAFFESRDFVLLDYAFRLLAKRRRHLGLDAIKELAPWLAPLLRRPVLKGGLAIALADSFWDFTSEEERAWLAKQPALSNLVPPPIESALMAKQWYQKQGAFERLRARDPAHARAVIEKPPRGLSDDDRQRLMALLREGLSSDDRDLLEREGSPLLILLPESSLWREAGELAVKLVTIGGGTMTFTPPEKYHPVFRRLGISEEKGAHASWARFSTQEFWLNLFLGSAPLDYLERHWSLGPGAILDLYLPADADRKYHWAINGAIFRARSEAWSRALLERRAKFGTPPDQTLGDFQILSLAANLPPREREAVLDPLTDGQTNVMHAFTDVLDHIWTPQFTSHQIARLLASIDLSINPRVLGGFGQLVHHGNAAVIDDLPGLVKGESAVAQTARDELAAAWRERDEILSRF